MMVLIHSWVTWWAAGRDQNKTLQMQAQCSTIELQHLPCQFSGLWKIVFCILGNIYFKPFWHCERILFVTCILGSVVLETNRISLDFCCASLCNNTKAAYMHDSMKGNYCKYIVNDIISNVSLFKSCSFITLLFWVGNHDDNSCLLVKGVFGCVKGHMHTILFDCIWSPVLKACKMSYCFIK